MLVKSIEGALAVKDVVKDARATLENLAKVGYAKTSSKIRMLLVEKSIATLLTDDFTMFTNMQRCIVYEHDEVLVPSSSGLRNRIAFELHNAESGEDAGGSDTSSPRRS